MQILKRLFNQAERRSIERPSAKLTDPENFNALFGGGPIGPSTAPRLAAVYAAVRVISESIAQLPVHVYRRRRDGTKELVADHPVQRLIAIRPNPYQTSYAFREQAQAVTLLYGNSVAEIQRNPATGLPIALHPLGAGRWTPTLRNGQKVFRGGSAELQDDRVLHIPALAFDGVAGISPIALARRTLELADNAEKFGAAFFKNSSRPSGVLEVPGNLQRDQIDLLKSTWMDQYQGPENQSRIAFLLGGMKFTPIALPPEDAQYIENRKFQVIEIARLYRVPPHMIGDLERATFSNIEHQALEFVQHCMMPWVIRWEQEINAKLLPDGDHYVKFNLAGLMRGDTLSRYRAYAIGRQWGWLSQNEIRELEDLPPVDGGDEYLSPLNMQSSTAVAQEGNQP